MPSLTIDKNSHLSIQERFEIFDEQNPQVFVLFREFAQMMKRRGFARYSARAIFDRVRWEYDINPETDDTFKLNDIYYSRYARKLMKADPSFMDFFEIRQLRRP